MLTERELQAVRAFTGLLSAYGLAGVYTVALGRTVTIEEAMDAHERLHARYSPPDPPGSTYGEQERSTEPWSWWRRP